jgi:ATP-dependent DNA helicase RecQ
VTHEDIERAARELLGFESLRPGQGAAVQAVVDGHDTLAVMPTGSGKSAIYELSTALRGGPTVVVSPLIALQRDQVETIEERHIGEAAALNSSLSEGRREELLDELESHELDYLFLAPEQFAAEETLERLKDAGPRLFVVDEAHCVSEWGHDFRPEYLHLGPVIEALGHPTVLALTATAAPPVRAEILERLEMRDAVEVIRNFDRPNIHFSAETHFDEKEKLRSLVRSVVEGERPAIVYTATRRRAEQLAEQLRAAGADARPYHAGLRRSEREQTQDDFMDDRCDVVVATIAFGMGVDKPNVRSVVHAEISDSVDSYYQEIGRAGRDGEPARAVLFYRPEDVGLRRFFAGSGHLRIDEVLEVAEAVTAHADVHEIKESTGLSETKVTAALGRLEEVGVVELLPDGSVERTDSDVDLVTAALEATDAQDARKEYDRTRVEMIRGYAETPTCRRAYVLSYFGEDYDPPCGNCGNCDNCDAGHGVRAVADEPFAVGARVRHGEWGEGSVQRYDGDTMVVLFDVGGYRTLAVELVVERHLLKPA